MKEILFALSIITITFACNQPDSNQEQAVATPSKSIDYPADLVKVFDNHGTLAKWQSMKSMSYEIVKEKGNELQMIDLQTRAERIEGSNFKSGFDGSQYWVEADTSYKGRPKFYTNLIFYFYAMPFVLADEGINYSETPPLVYEGLEYPGFRISYDDGVGIASKDEYFIHFDSETYEMAWLGYTVTYFSGEKSEKISWRRYADWEVLNGLKLPTSMARCKSENGQITEIGKPTKFVNAMVSEKAFPEGKFAVPEGAKVVE